MSTEFRHILRITDTDVMGSRKVPYALASIRGVNLNLANVILKKAKINPDKRAGFLTDAEIEKIEDVMKGPKSFGMPGWFLNRRKDLQTGADLHLVGPDLDLAVKGDVKRMKEIKSWRGYRHAYGLKARGQRTRSTGRKGRAVGVRVKVRMREKR